MSILSAAYFHNEEAAVKHLENIVWANGIVCPKCGVVDNSGELKGKTARVGLRKCYACRKQFTVKVGTVFESSHIPLHKWLQAAYLMSSSKKGISAHQLHRTLEVTYKTAWFMAHRLREAMRPLNLEPMGGEGKVVEADETFVGGLEKNKHKSKRNTHSQGGAKKEAVVSMVERGGKVRSFHTGRANIGTIKPVLSALVHKRTVLLTDDASHYNSIGKDFAWHSVVKHSLGQYVVGEVHTNTIEGFFSVFKKGMKGVYQHCGKQHLQRYLNEFDFRYNEREFTDAERTISALKGISGKRLTYNPASQETIC
jgi:transposase-like protein